MRSFVSDTQVGFWHPFPLGQVPCCTAMCCSLEGHTDQCFLQLLPGEEAPGHVSKLLVNSRHHLPAPKHGQVSASLQGPFPFWSQSVQVRP